MTGTEIRVTRLDENSFRTLHISILQKINRAELTLGAAIHPHAYAWGIPRLFVKKSTKAAPTVVIEKVKVVVQKTAVRGSAGTVSHVVENMMSSLLLGVGERLR